MGDFRKCLVVILEFEGGYVNHPADPGGPTNKGIIQRVYDGWRDHHRQPRQSVKHITDLEVQAIYRERFWLVAGCEDLEAGLALMHFDTAVNMGVGRAKQFMVQSAGSLRQYSLIRENYYRSRPHFPTFGRGWLRRLEHVTKLALEWQHTSQSNPLEGPKRLFLNGDEIGVVKANLISDKLYINTMEVKK